MITVNVTGHGNWVITPDKLNELISWLKNNSMPVESTTICQDKRLLNE